MLSVRKASAVATAAAAGQAPGTQAPLPAAWREAKERAYRDLAEIGSLFAARHWFPATSGNLSCRIQADPLVFAVSASGRDKSRLQPDDVVLVDAHCRLIEPGAAATGVKPSAEAVVHSRIYQVTDCGCILHVHTVFNNLISEAFFPPGRVVLEGMELIKGLDFWEENARVELPVVENWHQLPQLAEAVGQSIVPRVPGVLVRKHGLYAWGKTPFEARRHVEAFEFLFQYLFHWMNWSRQTAGN